MKKTLLIQFIVAVFISFISNQVIAQNQSCLLFDGNNDYVKYSDDSTLGLMDGAQDYTIEAWIYPNSSTVAEYDRVLQRYYSFAIVMYDGNNDGNVEDWYFQVYDNNSASWKYYNTSGDATLTLDAWNHIAVIRDSGNNTLTLYVNGQDVTDGNQVGIPLQPSQSNDNLYIGSKKGSTPNNSFGGKIDEVRLTNTVSDINSSIYGNEYSTDSNTAGLFHFDEGSGTTTENAASSSNATLNNGVTWITDVSDLPLDGTLPLKLISFKANTLDNKVILIWKCENTTNIDYFEIQKSNNSHNWENSSMVDKKAFYKNKNSYKYEDNSPSETNYYRLQIVNKNGDINYSKILSVSLKKGFDINIFPNPVDDIFYISGLKDELPVEYKIYDISGKIVQQALTNGVVKLNNKNPGIYYLNIMGKTLRFIVK